jgi:hypothetical protein
MVVIIFLLSMDKRKPSKSPWGLKPLYMQLTLLCDIYSSQFPAASVIISEEDRVEIIASEATQPSRNEVDIFISSKLLVRYQIEIQL